MAFSFNSTPAAKPTYASAILAMEAADPDALDMQSSDSRSERPARQQQPATILQPSLRPSHSTAVAQAVLLLQLEGCSDKLPSSSHQRRGQREGLSLALDSRTVTAMLLLVAHLQHPLLRGSALEGSEQTSLLLQRRRVLPLVSQIEARPYPEGVLILECLVFFFTRAYRPLSAAGTNPFANLGSSTTQQAQTSTPSFGGFGNT